MAEVLLKSQRTNKNKTKTEVIKSMKIELQNSSLSARLFGTMINMIHFIENFLFFCIL